MSSSGDSSRDATQDDVTCSVNEVVSQTIFPDSINGIWLFVQICISCLPIFRMRTKKLICPTKNPLLEQFIDIYVDLSFSEDEKNERSNLIQQRSMPSSDASRYQRCCQKCLRDECSITFCSNTP